MYSIDLRTVEENQLQHTTNEILVPDAIKDEDHIIGTVAWINGSHLVAGWSNRIQNKLYLQNCDGAQCKLVC